jgi:hypothetical protein
MSDLYPEDFRIDPELPTSDQFTVASIDGKVGMGVIANVTVARGHRVTKFTGQLSAKIMQHSLQVSPEMHLHDPWFVGLLTHSCAPNCVLDMQRLEVWALNDIRPGELLTIDYAMTEDVLHRQFACGCGSSHCRRWITGRREIPNEMGRAYLAGLDAKTVKRMVLRPQQRGVQ